MNEIISPQFRKKLVSWLKSFKLSDIDLTIIITAFTHPSHKGLDPNAEDYERLEFLGDAVLDLVTAEELIKASREKEGLLTEHRKQIVNNEYLAQIFDRLKIKSFIRTAVNYTPSIKDKANFLEAFLEPFFKIWISKMCISLENNSSKNGKDT